ncbi:transposase [Muricoccus vinaceus]|uniref:Transposase n=1 Tax=Muricoccus vinaceus TaxID=424704 RepID=A0ABV6IUI5_9PROT
MLDILVQDRRNGSAAKRFFKRLLSGLKYKPRRLVTDRLKSYGVAQRELLPKVRYRSSRYLNNRAENSHRPTRRRERQMQRFKSAEQAQRFLSAHSMIYGHFRPRRHLMTATKYPAPKRHHDPAAPAVTRPNLPSRQTTCQCRQKGRASRAEPLRRWDIRLILKAAPTRFVASQSHVAARF